MGAGRKTETYTLAQAQDGLYGSGGMSMRNLKKGNLCGVIFGCKFSTMKECYAKKLFGLPEQHMAYIKNIDPGLTLFLFNYSDRTLHGIFEAASEGKMNIDPKAWSPNGTDPTPFPAQVKVRVRVRCEPLVEEKFTPVIAENYWCDGDENLFWFELDRGQTNKLLRLFKPSPSVRVPLPSKDAAPASRKGIPASSLAPIGNSGSKWSSLFKNSDDSSENKEKEGADRAGSRFVNLGKGKGWEAAADNADEGKARPSASQSGPSHSSVLRNANDFSTLVKKPSPTSAVPSQASKGIENPWSSTSRAQSLRQDSIGFRNTSKEGENVKVSAIANSVIRPPSKEDSAEDTYSDIDWDAASYVHLEGLNKILEEPTVKDGFNRFEASSSSSSMIPNHWEDEKNPWDYQEKNTDKSPCGSSYVSAFTGEAVDDLGDDREKQHRMDNLKCDMGSPVFVDVLNEILAEMKQLKVTQIQQADKMIALEMELLESRIEILRLQGRNGNNE